MKKIVLGIFLIVCFSIESVWSYTATISCSPTMPICPFQNVTFTVVVSGCTSYTLQWQVNSVNAGTAATYSSSSLNNNDTVLCIVSSISCSGSPVTSNMIIASVIPVPSPLPPISGPDTVCHGIISSIYSFSTPTQCTGQIEWYVLDGADGTFQSTYTSNDSNTINWSAGYISPPPCYIKARCTDSCGTLGPWSPLYAINVISCAGIVENNFLGGINISPNPSTDKLSITGFSGKGEINIYNTVGEKVFKSEIQNPKSEIDIRNLPAGIYFVKVLAEEKMVVKKVVKM